VSRQDKHLTQAHVYAVNTSMKN